jgi:hypothetical protein
VGKIFGILSIIFGIIGILGGMVFLGMIFGPLAIIFGLIGLWKDDSKALSILGILLGIIAIGIFIWLLYSIAREIQER